MSDWNPVWLNYCLKGSQVSFIEKAGRPKRLGNSVIDRINGHIPMAHSSCMTCHALASFGRSGEAKPLLRTTRSATWIRRGCGTTSQMASCGESRAQDDRWTIGQLFSRIMKSTTRRAKRHRAAGTTSEPPISGPAGTRAAASRRSRSPRARDNAPCRSSDAAERQIVLDDVQDRVIDRDAARAGVRDVEIARRGVVGEGIDGERPVARIDRVDDFLRLVVEPGSAGSDRRSRAA